MKQHNTPADAGERPAVKKERIRFFALGFLLAAIITTAVFWGVPHITANSALTGEVLLGSSNAQIQTIENFTAEVLQYEDIMLLLVVPEDLSPLLAGEMNRMAETLSAKCEYALKKYVIDRNTLIPGELDINYYESPIFAMVQNGKLLGKVSVLNIIGADTVVDWAESVIPVPHRELVFYRMYPKSIQINNAGYPYEHTLGEVSLFPYYFNVEGYKPCTPGNRLQAKDYAPLHELLGAPETDTDGTFALPDYSNALPHADLSYAIRITGLPPDADRSVSSITVGGITYNQHALDAYGQKEFYLGEIVLAASEMSPEAMRSHGLLPCDGASLNVNEYAALFSLLGTRYGGNALIKFNLPDLSAVTSPIPSTSYYIARQGTYPSRD